VSAFEGYSPEFLVHYKEYLDEGAKYDEIHLNRVLAKMKATATTNKDLERLAGLLPVKGPRKPERDAEPEFDPESLVA